MASSFVIVLNTGRLLFDRIVASASIWLLSLLMLFFPGLTEAANGKSIPTFHGNDAFAYLEKQTEFGARNPNSAGHEACLGFLADTLRRSADQVRLQHFTHTGYDEELWLTNVIASFRPELQNRILLCAHWDTRPRADRDENPMRRNQPILGANDGASGVAVLLHLARLMKALPPPIGVDLVLFDGEDYGFEGDPSNYLLGSRFFASEKSADYQPRFGILLDMVGDKSLELPQEQNSIQLAPDIVELVWGKARELGIRQFSSRTGEAIIDDHLPLNDAGVRTIDIIDLNYPDHTNRFWHTHNDIPQNCSPESLEAVGRVLVHVIYTQR
jgi:glutaminyl-peptide cyclotransferase